MKDDSQEMHRLEKLRESAASCFNLIQNTHDSSASVGIIKGLLELLAYYKYNGDYSSKLWIWGYVAKFLSKQTPSYGCSNFQEKLALILRELFNYLAVRTDGTAESKKYSSKLVQLLVVLTKILSKNPSALSATVLTALRDGALSLSDAQVRESIYTILPQLIMHIEIEDSQEYKIERLDAKFGMNMRYIVDVVPGQVNSLPRMEFKKVLDRLLRLAMCSNSPLRSGLDACLTRIFLIMPNTFTSDLFSKSLVEQIYIARIFPFSCKAGSEIAGRELFTSILALCRLNKDRLYAEMILDAISNLIREEILDTSHIQSVLDMFKGCADCPPRIIMLLIPIVSFKQMNDLLEVCKDHLKPSPHLWSLFSALATSKLPDIVHKRTFDMIEPLLIDNTWTRRFTKLSNLEIYARYSSNLDVFEKPFISKHQSEFLSFYQKEVGSILSLHSPTIDYKYAISDPITTLINKLERLLTELTPEVRQRHQKRIQALLDSLS